RSPFYDFWVFLALVQFGAPSSVFIQHKRENINALFSRRFIFELGDAEGLAVGNVATAKRNKQNTQVASIEPVLGELLRLIAVRSPVFHRVHRKPRPAQGTNDVGSMILKIYEGRRDKGSVGHVSLRFRRLRTRLCRCMAIVSERASVYGESYNSVARRKSKKSAKWTGQSRSL